MTSRTRPQNVHPGRRRRAVWAFPLTVVVALVLAGCGASDDGQEVDFKVPVSVEAVGLGDVEDRIVATGTLRAAEVVTLTVETGGVLEIARSASGRRFGEGDRVKAGQVVAEITGEDARLAARIAATRQRFASAESDHEATKKLFDQGLITDTELRNAEVALEEARLEYDRSRRIVARNRLVTPIDGMILRLARNANGQPVAAGQLVVPGFIVAEVAPTDELVADVDLVGPDVARVTVGLPARVRHHAWSGRDFAGSVIRLAPTIDPITRALRAEVEVGNGEELLRPGMFVEVTLIAESRTGVPVVPRQAVTDRGGKRVVFVLRGQSVTQREVSLGLGDDLVVEVLDGVVEGERIVIRGLETLKDKMRVRVSNGA